MNIIRVVSLLWLLAGTSSSLYTQQWVDKKNDYDSLMSIPYGEAINYAGTTDTLTMDIFLPRCDDPAKISKRPVLLLIHGGAWVTGSKNDASIQFLCREFAKRGYVTAAVGYRLGLVADDAAWSCNYPNYPCLFATDTAEWYRAYYRAVQDAKGAIRFLVNKSVLFRIDTDHIFIAGESAGAFTALGAALLDMPDERPSGTNAISAVPAPNPNAANCPSIQGVSLPASINRPDLGSIDGTIEPTVIPYSIKGVGNIFGGMFTNLLAQSPAGKVLPAIYSYHQPCDIIVSIDSMPIFWGLSWCFTNGYNCFGIKNTPTSYGSRTFSNWNSTANYGYTIQNDFTGPAFPYQFLIGQASCLDQVNKPCHAYDNISTREQNMAQFFAPLIAISPICDTGTITSTITRPSNADWHVFPNPVDQQLLISVEGAGGKCLLFDYLGRIVHQVSLFPGTTNEISVSSWPSGMYTAIFQTEGKVYRHSFQVCH